MGDRIKAANRDSSNTFRNVINNLANDSLTALKKNQDTKKPPARPAAPHQAS
jgi:hypothetical protein